MPRDPLTKEFSYSAGVPMAENSTLDSGDFNAALDDLVADFNAPLPIEMGGLGSNSLETGLTNIGAASTFYFDDALVGFCFWFLRPTPGPGWLLADGRAVSRVEYPLLFQRISTTWGAGNGSTTFNLPDMRGVFIRGADLGRGIDEGRLVGTSQADDNETHTHTASSTANAGHNHAIFRTALVTGPSPPVSLVVADAGGGTGRNQLFASQTTSSAGNHTHDLALQNTGSEFRPRNVALLGCIFAGISLT